MRILTAATALLATPALAHPAAAGSHIPHGAYAAVVIAGLVAFVAYKTLKR